MYRLFARLYPFNIRNNYKNLLTYSGIKIQYDRFIGFVLSFSLVLSFALSLNILMINRSLNLFFMWLILFVFIQALIYFYLLLSADAKGKEIEKVLPDALSLMSSNLKAGYTTDKAFLLSSRPEFGILAEEINKVGKDITIGEKIENSLLKMSSRIKSEKLEKTISLIISGLKSGGELSSLLSQSSYNLRNQDLIDQKIRSSVLMYVIFIFTAAGIGAPILFGLSSFLVQILTEKLAAISIPVSAIAIPIGLSKINIDPNFIFGFSVLSLFTTSILGSLVLGLIAKGKEKEGLKYTLPLLILSLGIFFIVRFLISRLLAGLFV